MIVNDELEKIWKEVAVADYQALFQNYLQDTERNHIRNLSG
jgi:hypothetical protein